MTTEEALERLRPNWSLFRDEDYATDELGWAICSLMNGEHYQRLGWGKTVAEAVETAEQYVEQEEREQAERTADYQRRKAAGLLTPLEIASERAGEIWSSEALRMVAYDSILAQRVNRAFESSVVSAGDVIRVGGLDTIR